RGLELTGQLRNRAPRARQLDDSPPVLRCVWWMGSWHWGPPPSFLPNTVYKSGSTPEQIVGLQFTEDSSALPGAIAEDACNRQLGVVVEDRPRYSAKELEADIVTFTEGLGALRRIGLHQASIAVRQIHREEVDLALLTRDHRERFAEVDLCVSGIVAQWHEHLAQPLAALVHVAPYDRDPAAVPVLIAEPLEDPLSGVVLLG